MGIASRARDVLSGGRLCARCWLPVSDSLLVLYIKKKRVRMVLLASNACACALLWVLASNDITVVGSELLWMCARAR